MVTHNNDVLFTCSEMSGLASQKPIMSKPKKKKSWSQLSWQEYEMKALFTFSNGRISPAGWTLSGWIWVKKKKKKKGPCTWQLLGVNVSVDILFYLSPECSIRRDAFKSNLGSWSMKLHSISPRSRRDEERMFGSVVFNFCPFCKFLHTRLCWGGIKLQPLTCTHVLTRSPPFWSRLKKITCCTRIFDFKMYTYIVDLCFYIIPNAEIYSNGSLGRCC